MNTKLNFEELDFSELHDLQGGSMASGCGLWNGNCSKDTGCGLWSGNCKSSPDLEDPEKGDGPK